MSNTLNLWTNENQTSGKKLAGTKSPMKMPSGKEKSIKKMQNKSSIVSRKKLTNSHSRKRSYYKNTIAQLMLSKPF